MSAILPDCTRCGGPVELDIDGNGEQVEACRDCGLAAKPIRPRINRAEVRAQVRQIRRARPLLCPSCLDRRCRACHVVTCECPGNHPRRPVGDLTPEGMVLLAGERQGYLEMAELPGGTSRG